MDKEVEEHASAISKWLRENRNPYVAIEITDSGVKLVTDRLFIPTRGDE